MKRLLSALALGVCLAAPAAAQSPAEIISRAIVDVSGNANAAASDWCQVLRISNLVAWRLWTNRAAPAPYGLLHKEIGTRAVLRADGSCVDGEHTNDPAGFALDYVIERTSGYGWDIVTSWGAAQWPAAETTNRERNWRDFTDPFDPAPYLGGAQPPPVVLPPAGPPPVVVPPVVFDVAALAAQLAQLQRSVDTHARGLSEAIAVVNQNVSDGRNENRSAWRAVADHWKSIVMVAGPAVTWWTTRQMQQK